ncbi:MAG: GNAT family N-acetyltransferase [Clostridia bacterium]|nr:GNAT family N-acetyltransferase [Clostridia bacterium]
MNIRKILKEDKFEAYLISSYCFHARIDDVEKERERIESETDEDWGAFADDGKLAARLINNHFELNIDGTAVKSGGVGAVSTLPEYRNSGAVKLIFKELLPECYRNGDVLSTLFPFNHAFYRKQGYDTVTYKNEYELTPAMLRHIKTDCNITMWNGQSNIADYLDIYNEFSKNYNIAMVRDEKEMLSHVKSDSLYKDRKFSYLFTKNGENLAYLTFTDVYDPAGAIMRVNEALWKNTDGFYGILAFLGRFDSDYAKIELPLPCGIDLLRILRTEKEHDIKKKTRHDFMIRVINAEKILELINKPENCDFVIRVTDDIIYENNAMFRVTGNSVTRVSDDTEPDIYADIRSFSQLVTGCISLEEAVLKPDVTVYKNEEMLAKVFRERKIFINEFF